MYENGTTARLGAKSAPRDSCRDPSFRLRRSDRRLTRMMIMNWKEMEMGFILHMNALTLCRLAYKILTLHNPEGLHLILTHRRFFFGTSATASEIQSPMGQCIKSLHIIKGRRSKHSARSETEPNWPPSPKWICFRRRDHVHLRGANVHASAKALSSIFTAII